MRNGYHQALQGGGALSLLYLHGLSSGAFVPTLGQLLGSTAGLSVQPIRSAEDLAQDDVSSRP